MLFHRGLRPTAVREQGAQADTAVEVNHQLTIRQSAQIGIAPVGELLGLMARHPGWYVDNAFKLVGVPGDGCTPGSEF